MHPGTPASSTYLRLRHVTLDILIDPRYAGAVACHDHMLNCVRHLGSFSYNPSFPQYIENLYRTYPAPLKPDALTSVFLARINTQIIPYVMRDAECHTPDVEVFYQNPLLPPSDAVKFMNLRSDAIHTPGTLTITLKVDVFDKTTPRIAVLSATRYRPDHFQFNDSHAVVQPIPLDMTDAQISSLTKLFAEQAVPLMGIRISHF